jgi:hypothetical protein|tara:strand:+ start:645 stop:1031 length:387 start_codon:yes stop_codon:yes gene_type:complete
MANQTFKVAGITTHNGNTKVRFTDDMIRRIKQFTKGGASRIDLVELPSEMTKVEALKYLASHAEFQSPSDQATIADSLDDRVKESSKGEVKVKSTKAKPSMVDLKARAKKKSTKEVSAEQILAEVGTK